MRRWYLLCIRDDTRRQLGQRRRQPRPAMDHDMLGFENDLLDDQMAWNERQDTLGHGLMGSLYEAFTNQPDSWFVPAACTEIAGEPQITHDIAGIAQTVREQRRRLLWAAGGGLLAGMLLWSFLPGAIVRTVPAGWHWPEAMAAHIIGKPTRWRAGARLMQADSPEAWTALTQAADILRDNREAIEKCRYAATAARGLCAVP